MCDAEQRAALAVVRSLERRGHLVAVCSHERKPLAGGSRWAQRTFVVPNPARDRAAFVRAIDALAAEWRATIVVPVTDQSTLALLGERETLTPAIVPGPSLESFVRISNKRAALEVARTLGVDVPSFVVIDHPVSDASQLRTLQAPYVIKSSSHGSGSRHPVAYASSGDQAVTCIAAAPHSAFPLIVQERVIGPGIGVFLLLHRGEIIAEFAHERIREDPPSGGAAVYAQSIPMSPALRDAARRILMAHQWEGVAMVEFKRDQVTGRDYLMEVNGRFWGSLQLAIDAGVDFPALLIDATRGRNVTPVKHYAHGVTLRSEWRDVGHLLTRLRHSPAALDMPPGSGGRLDALRSFLRWSFSERAEVFRWNDPRPFVRDTIAFVMGRIRRGGRA